jgi:hypothetical protein
MAPVCFGCGGAFERALLEEVGDQLFCRLCLGRLLRRVEERGASPADVSVLTASDAAPSAASGSASAPTVAFTPNGTPVEAPCFLCGGPLGGEAFVRLRGFAICNGCSRALAGDGPPEDSEDDVAPAPAAPPEEPVTPGSGVEWCAGCGRAMPGPGSYRVIEGQRLCAACAAERPAAPRTHELCDACRRPTPADSLRPTRGFRICVACNESDPALALALAQARHRRRLERQSRRLLDDGDDD